MSVVAVAVCMSSVAPAYANKPLKLSWIAVYAGDDADEDYKELVSEAGCYVCHVHKESKKKVRNPYGKALHEALEKDGFPMKEFKKEYKEHPEKYAERLKAIFKKIEAEKSGDEKHKTFGDRIKAKLLPGGNVKGKKDD